MATLTKQLFSESASGRRFVINASVASAADCFHVVPSTPGILDEVWVYAHNFGNDDTRVSFLWAMTAMPSLSTTDVTEAIDITIPFKSGRALVWDGTLLPHSVSACAYAETPGVISIDGFVNRMT